MTKNSFWGEGGGVHYGVRRGSPVGNGVAHSDFLCGAGLVSAHAAALAGFNGVAYTR